MQGYNLLRKSSKLYKQKIGLKLLYKSTYDGDKDKIYLVYSMLNMDLGIDAKDGEVVNLNDYFRLYEKAWIWVAVELHHKN